MTNLEETKNRSIKNFKMIIFYKLLSLILLMVKNHLLANKIGSYYNLQMYSQSFFLVTMAVDIIAGGLILALVPSLVQARVDEGKEKSVSLCNNILHIMVLMSLIIMALNFVLAPKIARLFTSELTSQELGDLTLMIRLGSPLIFIILTRSVFLGFLQSNHKFKAGATGPVILNLIKIVYLLLFKNQNLISFMLVSILANAGYYIKAIPLSKESGYYYKRELNLKDSYLESFKSLIFPLILIGLFNSMDSSMTNYLSKLSLERSGEIFSDGKYLINVFLNLVIITIITVVFPILSEFFEENRRSDYNRVIGFSLEWLMKILIPFIFISLLFSQSLVVLFSDLVSKDELVYVLRISSIGLIFTTLNLLFFRILYSIKLAEWGLMITAFGFGIKYFLGKMLVIRLGVKSLALAELVSNLFIFISFILLFKNYNIRILDKIIRAIKGPIKLSLFPIVLSTFLYLIIKKTNFALVTSVTVFTLVYIFMNKKSVNGNLLDKK